MGSYIRRCKLRAIRELEKPKYSATNTTQQTSVGEVERHQYCTADFY